MFIALPLVAQTAGGTITGTVFDPVGSPLPEAVVEIRSTGTGGVVSTTTAANGAYMVGGLVPGNYDIAVLVGGRTHFQQNGLTVQAGRIVSFDAHLKEDGQLGTIGDDFIANAALARRPVPNGPVPRALDGHPDLSGVWAPTYVVDPGKPEFLPWAAAEVKKRIENNAKDIPTASCLPWGPTFDIPVTFKFVQSPKTIVVLFEDVFSYRQIHIDGRSHPKDADPTWMGHSVGHWEGETLIVDTAGFNDKSWTPVPFPHTEKLHIIERIHRLDAGHLEIETMIEDPGTYTKPWTFKRATNLLVGEEIGEYICAENNQYRGNAK